MNNTNKIQKIVTEFAVYDKLAEMFMQPFRSANKLKALQGFKDVANDPKSNINKHPEDYQLFEIGTFNEETAERTNELKLLATASDLIEKEVITKNG